MTGLRTGSLVGVLGGALALAGFLSVGVALIPVRMGNLDWEFGAFGEAAVGFGLPFVGLALLALVAVRSSGVWARVLVLLGLAALAIVALLGLFLVVTDLPLVWQAARQMDAMNARSVKVVLVKTMTLSSLYALATLWTMGILVRSFGRQRK